MYYKDELHEEGSLELMKAFDLGFSTLEDNREFGAFCYLVGATYKTKDIINSVGPDGIDMDTIEQTILVYSSSEIGMIRFGLQLYNGGIDDITLPEVMFGLDEQNEQVVYDAIGFRYKLQQST